MWNYHLSLRGRLAGNHAVFSNDEQKLIAVDDSQILVLDTCRGGVIQRLKGHTGFISGAQFSDDGSRVLSSSCQGMTAAACGAGPVLKSQIDAQIAEVTGDATARVWDMASARQLFVAEFKYLGNPRFSRDGRYFGASAAVDDVFETCIIKTETGEDMSSRFRGRDCRHFCDLSATGERLLSVRDGLASVWDIRAGEVSSAIPDCSPPYRWVGGQFGPSEEYTLLESNQPRGGDGRYAVWDCGRESLLRTIDAPVLQRSWLAFSWCGQFVAMLEYAGDHSTQVVVYDMTSNSSPVVLRSAAVAAVFAPDDSAVICATPSDSIDVFSSTTGCLLGTFTPPVGTRSPGPGGGKDRIAVSPSGSILVRSGGGVIHVWKRGER